MAGTPIPPLEGWSPLCFPLMFGPVHIPGGTKVKWSNCASDGHVAGESCRRRRYKVPLPGRIGYFVGLSRA